MSFKPSKLAFILSPKKLCEIHLYKNGHKKSHQRELKKKFYMLFLNSNNVIVVQSLMVMGLV